MTIRRNRILVILQLMVLLPMAYYRHLRPIYIFVVSKAGMAKTACTGKLGLVSFNYVYLGDFVVNNCIQSIQQHH